MPCIAGFHHDVKTEPAVDIDGLCRRAGRSDPYRTYEITIGVPSQQILPLTRPLRGDPAAPLNAACPDLAEVCEVEAQRYLKLKPYWPHAVIGDLKVFVHAAAD